MQRWSPRPKKELAPWLFGRRPGWTSRGAGRAAWGGVAGVTGGVEGLALAADPPLVLPSRLSGLGPSGPGSWRAGSGRASRSADAEAAPRGAGWSRPRPPASRGFQQAVGSLRWKLVEPVALRSLSTCAPACGTGGRIPAAAEAEGWGKGRGAPGRGRVGQNTPPPTNWSGPGIRTVPSARLQK